MCGSESVLRQNLINCNQSFQLCNKGLKRRSFATKMWHCFPLNNEVVTAAVILCQIIGSKENSSIIMLLRFGEVLETLENNVLKSQLLECYKAFSFAMRKWFAQFAYLLVTKVSVIYCSKFCSENLSRNYKLYVLLCTLGNMKELKEKKKKVRKTASSALNCIPSICLVVSFTSDLNDFIHIKILTALPVLNSSANESCIS